MSRMAMDPDAPGYSNDDPTEGVDAPTGVESGEADDGRRLQRAWGALVKVLRFTTFEDMQWLLQHAPSDPRLEALRAFEEEIEDHVDCSGVLIRRRLLAAETIARLKSERSEAHE